MTITKALSYNHQIMIVGMPVVVYDSVIKEHDPSRGSLLLARSGPKRASLTVNDPTQCFEARAHAIDLISKSVNLGAATKRLVNQVEPAPFKNKALTLHVALL